MAHFQIPLNLPHAGKVAWRIVQVLDSRGWQCQEGGKAMMDTARKLQALLLPYMQQDDNPGAEEAARICAEAAALGRSLVDEIERAGAQDDRLGQCVRNLFECIELGPEGADISLRAGENPNSAQRPWEG